MIEHSTKTFTTQGYKYLLFIMMLNQQLTVFNLTSQSIKLFEKSS